MSETNAKLIQKLTDLLGDWAHEWADDPLDPSDEAAGAYLESIHGTIGEMLERGMVAVEVATPPAPAEEVAPTLVEVAHAVLAATEAMRLVIGQACSGEEIRQTVAEVRALRAALRSPSPSSAPSEEASNHALLLKALRAVEWAGGDAGTQCPECRVEGHPGNDHHERCIVGKALRVALSPPQPAVPLELPPQLVNALRVVDVPVKLCGLHFGGKLFVCSTMADNERFWPCTGSAHIKGQQVRCSCECHRGRASSTEGGR